MKEWLCQIITTFLHNAESLCRTCTYTAQETCYCLAWLLQKSVEALKKLCGVKSILKAEGRQHTCHALALHLQNDLRNILTLALITLCFFKQILIIATCTTLFIYSWMEQCHQSALPQMIRFFSYTTPSLIACLNCGSEKEKKQASQVRPFSSGSASFKNHHF